MENAAPARSEITPTGPRVAVGTSGFAYDEWRSTFYPDKLPAKQFLAYYAQHFATTEINATFYRFPRSNVTESWARDVPAEFAFTLKMSQRVTHVKRLKDVDREIGWFCDGAYTLGPKLGAVLIQLPPNMQADNARLEDFLSRHASRLPFAVEFRHDSWYTEATYDVLRKHAVALAVVENEEGDTVPRPRLATGRFVYMRLRKGEYTDAELQEWADWIRAQGTDVFCYLKHDLLGPSLAQRLMVHLGLLDVTAPVAPTPTPPAAAPKAPAKSRTRRST